MAERSDKGSVLFAFLTGAAVGAAVAYLTAPGSGREIREGVRRSLRGGYDRATSLPEAVRRAASQAGRAARETFLREYEHTARPGRAYEGREYEQAARAEREPEV